MILDLQLFSTRYQVALFHILLKFGWGANSSFDILLRILAQQARDVGGHSLIAKEQHISET